MPDCTKQIALIEAMAAPKLCPVSTIFDTWQVFNSSLTCYVIFLSLSLQSALKPTCIQHFLHPPNGSISIVKSYIQFSALALPLHEMTTVLETASYPMQAAARVTSLLTWVTLISLGYLALNWQDHDSRHFLGQQARMPYATYTFDCSRLYQESMAALGWIEKAQAVATRATNSSKPLLLTIFILIL